MEEARTATTTDSFEAELTSAPPTHELPIRESHRCSLIALHHSNIEGSQICIFTNVGAIHECDW